MWLLQFFNMKKWIQVFLVYRFAQVWKKSFGCWHGISLLPSVDFLFYIFFFVKRKGSTIWNQSWVLCLYVHQKLFHYRNFSLHIDFSGSSHSIISVLLSRECMKIVWGQWLLTIIECVWINIYRHVGMPFL